MHVVAKSYGLSKDSIRPILFTYEGHLNTFADLADLVYFEKP